jgi:hypothetical protein
MPRRKKHIEGSQLDQVDPLEGEDTAEPSSNEPEEGEQEDYPSKIQLTAPHAYYEDDGTLKAWQQGQVIDDPDEVAHLVDRGALHEEVK